MVTVGASLKSNTGSSNEDDWFGGRYSSGYRVLSRLLRTADLGQQADFAYPPNSSALSTA